MAFKEPNLEGVETVVEGMLVEYVPADGTAEDTDVVGEIGEKAAEEELEEADEEDIVVDARPLYDIGSSNEFGYALG